mmetsp:Transcript_12379/g.31054  ORF Transcript_12379/g.31054 Transcript_12379/m.31054 type:complete len:228 (-) Transcript_12379:649-1332(-)
MQTEAPIRRKRSNVLDLPQSLVRRASLERDNHLPRRVSWSIPGELIVRAAKKSVQKLAILLRIRSLILDSAPDVREQKCNRVKLLHKVWILKTSFAVRRNCSLTFRRELRRYRLASIHAVIHIRATARSQAYEMGIHLVAWVLLNKLVVRVKSSRHQMSCKRRAMCCVVMAVFIVVVKTSPRALVHVFLLLFSSIIVIVVVFVFIVAAPAACSSTFRLGNGLARMLR